MRYLYGIIVLFSLLIICDKLESIDTNISEVKQELQKLNK